MNPAPPYQVLLYYHYTPLADAEQYAAEHRALCTRLSLLGRIIIAAEGINGTVSGTTADTDAYMATLHCDPRFAAMKFKIDPAEGHAFHKLLVRVKPEIVKLGLDRDVNPLEHTGHRLSPAEFRQALERDDVILIDARNDYEYDLGHFRGAIRPPVKTFSAMPDWVRQNLADQKDKTVLTYCTGGIRCEKFSGFLLDEGFKNVFQLDGGIINYGKDPAVRGEKFDGKCYVFDERVSVEINHTEGATVTGTCHHCGTPCERPVNCANLNCGQQFLCCTNCELTHRRSCQTTCESAANHEFDLATAGTPKAYYR